MGYIPGDYWMICQRTGGKFRQSEMRKEWTGLWVHESVFDYQHPQDFVTGIPDDPSVSPAFPDVPQTMGETTLNGALTKDATSVTLTSATGMVENDSIGIVLDNDASAVTSSDEFIHWTFITADESSNVVTLKVGVPSAAASGNKVYKPSTNSEEWDKELT